MLIAKASLMGNWCWLKEKGWRLLVTAMSRRGGNVLSPAVQHLQQFIVSFRKVKSKADGYLSVQADSNHVEATKPRLGSFADACTLHTCAQF